MTSSSTSTAATVAAIAAGCSLLAYGASRVAKSSPQQPDLADLDELDDEDCIGPDDVVAIFDKLFMTMQQVVMQLSQQVQQIQMAGQSIPEKQLRQLLKGEFERALTQCQAQVFEDNDVDADCLEEATWEFMESPEEYPKVKRAVERFQKLYDSISGEETFGWTPNKAKKNDKAGKASSAKRELTPDELMKAATMYFEEITRKMVEMAKEWKESGKNLSDPQVSKQFQMEASTDGNEAGEEKIMKEMGISMSEFRSAIDKHSRLPAVGQTLGMLQIKQQQELMAAGVPMTM
eukprot:CAMPEP_0172527924 /NCGR_PEP_ID=MMETSP1067-20121228/2463_1 /TAXON_ID=265564 ORGANISM="Thalassiosira punctigera, Strain Tpunct2005C2" /NCGR_SAMPLE_ID=MMETSP1067 /ASSEMBLY_ACC=CAM_ASM_000444 /LENGTH=290 /DNA_ID=CAMNT_0013311751 /DNA_START=43 /DNA_END=915 /DNA_ORIENTATION=-